MATWNVRKLLRSFYFPNKKSEKRKDVHLHLLPLQNKHLAKRLSIGVPLLFWKNSQVEGREVVPFLQQRRRFSSILLLQRLHFCSKTTLEERIRETTSEQETKERWKKRFRYFLTYAISPR